MSKRLTLPLKSKWFDMIKSREKLEEYREITTYWATRLTNLRGTVQLIKGEEDFKRNFVKSANVYIKHNFQVFRKFDEIEFTKGYPKREDNDRRLIFKNPHICISAICREEWGAEPYKFYFKITWEDDL